MKTYYSLEHTHTEELPGSLRDDDVRYPPGLVQLFLDEYTVPGERVLDPFAGYGTTLITAQAAGRLPYGVELDEAKVTYTLARLDQPGNLVHGDARRLSAYNLPQFDFSMTSPPFMTLDEATDPLSDYTGKSQGYRAYLREMGTIYAQLRNLMKPAGVVVIEVSNLKQHGRVTTLAWDLGAEIARVLHFEGEVVICWDKYGYGYDHSYCLVYSAI
jgi:hypothetical protein